MQTSSSSSSSSTTSTAAAAAAAVAVGKIDPDPSAIELLLVETFDGGISLLAATECDETEAARAAGVAISHHDRLMGRKRESATPARSLLDVILDQCAIVETGDVRGEQRVRLNRYTHQEPCRTPQRPVWGDPRWQRIGDNIRGGRNGANTSDQETKRDQGTKSRETCWADTDGLQGVIGRVPAQIPILFKAEAQTGTHRFKRNERRGIACGGRGRARQDNQHRREGGDSDETDPTYNFADMIIGVLSY